MKDILWLARTDHEASAGMAPPSDGDEVGVADWIRVAPRDTSAVNWLYYRLLKRLTGLLKRSELSASAVEPMQTALFDRVARAHLQRGTLLLARGRVVVTDRLHGHILCLLMGIPHVVLDNSYGKLSSFRETWTRSSHLAADSHDGAAALSLAREMVDSLD